MLESDKKIRSISESGTCVIPPGGSDRNTEKQNFESLVKYKSLFENCMDAIFLSSPDGTIHSANPAATKMLGWTEEEICSLGRSGIVDTSDPALAVALEERETKGNFRGVITLKRKDGSKFPAELSSSVFTDSEGRLLTSMIIRDITEPKKAEKMLKESQMKLQKLTRHLEEAMEKERTLLALNLHDDLGQKLTALTLDIAWIRSRIGVQSLLVRNKLNEMNLLINETIESIKEISTFLRPSILFDLGLVPAILSQLDKFRKQSGIVFHFSYSPDELKIDDRLSLILYRVLQESLTNIARHSGASTVEVNLAWLKNKIEMVIKDNGKGIDPEKVNSLSSMGIAGIKERVKSVRGVVRITGEKDTGTRIVVSIPLHKNGLND
jgi:PAS domain S-box-containing protein